MGLIKKHHERLVEERLNILMGSMYDVRFYETALKDLLDKDVEALRDSMAEKKVELGRLVQAQAVAHRSKGELLPEEKEKLDKLVDEVNKLSGKGGEIDEAMEAQATMKALIKKEKNAKKYYKFVKSEGEDVLSDVEKFINE